MKKIIGLVLLVSVLSGCDLVIGRTLDYKLSGDASECTITYLDESENEFTETVTLPWGRHYTIPMGNRAGFTVTDIKDGKVRAEINYIGSLYEQRKSDVYISDVYIELYHTID